ncbi:MAG: nicotinamide-nucleotide amidohydrolase family protein [Bacteriovoracaceae bacterium]|nr:nicotinamide-nucleotide amidohydrolase family protein [Bacteriovoracaceae bacterium]
MQIALILIGDEILSSKVQDKNAPYLATSLSKKGLALSKISIISDQEHVITEEMQKALSQFDIIFVSGGLGPTLDDKTKISLSHLLQAPIEKNPEALVLAQANSIRLGKTFNSSLSQYDLTPRGCLLFNNPTGLALGLGFHDKENKKIILCAPGVPKEFSAMLEQEFFPYLEQHSFFPPSICEQMTFRVHGLPEEKIFFDVAPNLWEHLSHLGKVSSLPQTLNVDIGIFLQAESSEDLKNKKEKVKEILDHSPIAPYIWTCEPLTLPELIIKKCIEQKRTISLVESCTGGLISSELTNIPQASQVLKGAMVAYTPFFKQNFLDLSLDFLQNNLLVSEACAKAMAENLFKKTNTDLTMAITGVTGIGPDAQATPQGLAFVAITRNQKTQVHQLFFPQGSRREIKEKFCTQALFLLLKQLD